MDKTPDAHSPHESDHLIVVSLMSGAGTTGVETHFNAILKEARARGRSATLITPYSSSRWLQRLANFGVNLINRFHPERAHLLLREIHTRRVRRQLLAEVARAKGLRLIFYAQDPLSAELAIHARPAPHCPVIACAHFNMSESQEFMDKGVTNYQGRLYNELLRAEHEALPNVDRLIFVSKFMQERIQSRIPELKQVDTRVIPHFTDAPGIDDPDAPKKADAVAIGSLEPRKNQQFLLEVIHACREFGAEYTLDIIGTGENMAALKALTKQLDLEKQVRFLGAVPDAGKTIQDYRVFLHGARMESFGIVLIEALASSVPVFANAVGGVPEVFSDNKEGVYWKARNIRGSARQLMDVLNDANRYGQYQQAAYQRYAAAFHTDVVAPQWLQALYTPIETRKNHPAA